MTIRSRTVGWLLGAFLSLTSCATGSGGDGVNLASMRLQDLYFPEGEIISRLPATRRASTFCMKNIVKTDAGLAGVSTVTGFDQALRGAVDGSCDIEVSTMLEDFTPDITHGECQWKLSMDDDPRIVRMNIGSSDGVVVEECFLRLAMVDAGYPGALMLDSNALFMPLEESMWMSYSNFPRLVPRAPHIFQFCGVRPPHLTPEFELPDEIMC